MPTIRRGELAHVFLGAALALPFGGIAWVLAMSARSQAGRPLPLAGLAFLGVVAVVVVGAVSCAPQVRGVEIASARALLRLDLPDPAAPSARTPRLLGAAWLLVVALIGAITSIGLLLFLPLGLGLLLVPAQGGEVRIPGVPATWWAEGGFASGGWAVAGLLAWLAAYALLVLAVLVTRRLAPAFLAPTAADREVAAAAERRSLARANLLARELHDSVGHALTAMTLQADAARALVRRDPDAAEASLDRLADCGRAALAGLDGVLGALRSGTEPAQDPGILAELLAAPDVRAAGAEELTRLAPPDRADVARILQEAVTNARRHGSGPVELRVRRHGTGLVIRVDNAVPTGLARDGAAPGSGDGTGPGGRGLLGMRERALLLGASVHAGAYVDDRGTPRWAVDLEVPA